MLVALPAAGATAPAAAQSAVADSIERATAADSVAREAVRGAARPEGTRAVELRPGDLVKLYVWREPELSRDYEVTGAGRIDLPKLGPVDVTGLGPDALRRELETRYARYVRNPSIEVSIRRRISVLGAVKSPGVFQVDPYVTVAAALAMAGGPTSEARTDYVRVLRGDRTLRTRVSVRTAIADSPVESGDQLYVPDRGWATRNIGIVSAAISAGAMLLLAVRR